MHKFADNAKEFDRCDRIGLALGYVRIVGPSGYCGKCPHCKSVVDIADIEFHEAWHGNLVKQSTLDKALSRLGKEGM